MKINVNKRRIQFDYLVHRVQVNHEFAPIISATIHLKDHVLIGHRADM
jgi:hypothetical protein